MMSKNAKNLMEVRVITKLVMELDFDDNDCEQDVLLLCAILGILTAKVRQAVREEAEVSENNS